MKNIKPNQTITFILSVIFCFSAHHGFAQGKFKKYLFLGSTSLCSGMLDGTIESINYHYCNGFKPRFQKANDQFWNPALSWTNKYKDGNCNLGPKFLGSEDIFVCTTDAYHMLRTTKRGIDAFSIAYYLNQAHNEKISNRKKWENVVKDFLFVTAVRCVGFSLTYSLIFNPQNRPVF